MSKYSSEIAKIKDSGLFDTEWYRRKYPDTKLMDRDPIEHYLWLGSRLGRNPSPQFDTSFYVKKYPDAAKSGINPLVHYIDVGKAAGHIMAPPISEQSNDSHFNSILSYESAEDHETVTTLKEENELLLLQLHQVQEELETYYLKYQEIKNNSSGKKA